MANDVDEYLRRLSEEQREPLERLRRIIRSVVPGVEEVIRTRVPAFRYRGRPLVSIGAAKQHLSLFIMYGDVIKENEEELSQFDTSNTVVRFSREKPIPTPLVKKLVNARKTEIEGG